VSTERVRPPHHTTYGRGLSLVVLQGASASTGSVCRWNRAAAGARHGAWSEQHWL